MLREMYINCGNSGSSGLSTWMHIDGLVVTCDNEVQCAVMDVSRRHDITRDVELGTCTCTGVVLEYNFEVLVLVLVLCCRCRQFSSGVRQTAYRRGRQLSSQREC